jgi:HNH endonuclease/NUMOD3 motif-containing protein
MLVSRECLTCGKPFEVRQDFVKKGKGKFCSKACSKVGVLNPFWRGGIAKAGQYIKVYIPNHPDSNKAGYMLEHRLVMEAKIGRPLTKDEIVHHINHVKTDNDPDNLMILDRSSHKSLHNQGNKIWFGKKHTPETLKALSDIRKKYWQGNKDKITGENNPNYKHGKYICES